MAKRGTSHRDTWRKVMRLPGPARLAGLVLLGSAAVPAAAVVFAATGESALARFFEAHPAFVNLVAVCAAVAAVLALERPRSAAPFAYARQLRARVLELQSMFDADDRRRPEEGKEKEDDGLPSEP
jgi:pimeloyl-ACP methyl ester carboxylesterase